MSLDAPDATLLATGLMTEHPVQIAVANRTLQEAEACFAQHKWSEAFFKYLLAMQLAPSVKEECRHNFTSALKHWGEECEREGRFDELMARYQQAYEVFPECEIVVSNLGGQLFRLGYVDEAASYFRKALRINPGFVQARENLENLFGHLVERWHFRMLNDQARNQAYRDAIERAVKAGRSTVLDIGTGTGLLAMFAASAGARSVTGCEMSRTMYEMSHDVVAANHLGHHVHLVHKKSNDLIVGIDLPERVDLIVTETFDCGLFGEHILETLQHALKNLVREQSPVQVIPAGASVYVCAIECAALRHQHRILYKGVRYLDLSGVTILSKVGLSAEEADSESFDLDGMEPYTTERLKDLPDGYKLLSSVIKVCDLDFNNLEIIEGFMEGFSKDVILPIEKCGRLDALAMWFDLDLDSVTSLTSSPDARSCWEQAIYPVHPHHITGPDQHKIENLAVRPGYCLEANFKCMGNAFLLRCNKITRNSTSSVMSTSAELTFQSRDVDAEFNILPPRELLHEPGSASAFDWDSSCSIACDFNRMSVDNRDCCSLDTGSHSRLDNQFQDANANGKFNPMSLSACSEEIGKDWSPHYLSNIEVSFLNDLDYNVSVCQAVEKLLTALTEKNLPRRILDISQGISFVPLQALKLGADKVGVFGQSHANAELLMKVATDNSIDLNRLFVTAEHESLESLAHSISQEQIEKPGPGSMWAGLIVDLIESCGCLRQQILEDVALARMGCMSTGGVVLPEQVTAYGIIIESESLMKDSGVINNQVTLDYQVADFINVFQMSTHVDIHLSTLDHRRLSQPFELFTISLNQPLETTDDLQDFLNYSREFTVTCSQPGQVHAIVYWFDVTLFEGVKICTLGPTLHWKQAAVICKENLMVSNGTQLDVKTSCQNSCVSVALSMSKPLKEQLMV